METKVLKKEPLTFADIISELSKIKKGQITPIQQKVHDFAIRFSKINKAQKDRLVKELRALGIPTLTDAHICTIANLMPRDIVELRSIFTGTKTTITSENLQKVQEALKKYGK